ncbi:hypothetical protein ANN_25899 [Periplaneta americana]|uniref:Uncharacterized protein n=1 Tax=Periplaneta americana TaxID=6978 RepID=A0ABQ8S4T1_PERAM|nr:hypothetical protein ANN_25899 [Periplaneta americana]
MTPIPLILGFPPHKIQERFSAQKKWRGNSCKECGSLRLEEVTCENDIQSPTAAAVYLVFEVPPEPVSKRRRMESQKIDAKEVYDRIIQGTTHRFQSKLPRRNKIVEPLLEKLKRNNRRWCEHLQRMPNCRLPALAMGYKPKGKRDVGRPRAKWGPEQVQHEPNP